MSAGLMTQLRALADARADRETYVAELKSLREMFDLEHALLIGTVKALSANCDTIERDVRALAEAAYAASGEKAVAPGVVVKVFTTQRIVDRPAAEAWARQTKLALIPESLDEKALLKIAAVTPLAFVETLEQPRVTIATQLNAAVYAEVSA